MESERRKWFSELAPAVGSCTWLLIGIIGLILSPSLKADPLDNWKVRGQLGSPASVVFGNGRFVARTGNYSTSEILVSTNGADWRGYLPPESSTLACLAFGNGRFLAAFQHNTGSSNVTVIYSSLDGISWKLQALQSYPAIFYYNAKISGGNGIYVVSGQNLSVSTNLSDWSVVALGLGNFYDLTFGNGLFVASPWFSTDLLTSADGCIWEYQAVPGGRSWANVRCANGRFAAFCSAASDGSAPAATAVSLDGVSWSANLLPDFTNSTKLVSGGDKFFLLNTVSNGFFSSTDALTWEPRSFGTNVQITDIAFGANTYVAVGDLILQSDPVTNAPISHPDLAIQSYPGLTITGTVGQHYLVEYTEDLRATNTFQPLTNLFLNTSPFLWVDTAAPNSSRRFYRATLLP